MTQTNFSLEKSSVAQQSDTDTKWADYHRPAKETIVITDGSGLLVPQYVYYFVEDEFVDEENPENSCNFLSLFGSYFVDKASLAPSSIYENNETDYTKGRNVLIYSKTNGVINTVRLMFESFENSGYYKIDGSVQAYKNYGAGTTITNKEGYLTCNMIFEDRNNTVLICEPIKDANGGYTGKCNVIECTKAGASTPLEDKKPELVSKGVYRKAVYALNSSKLESGKRYILKKDAYLDQSVDFRFVDEIVLDGGNLFRLHNGGYAPRKVTCVNGAFVDIPSPSTRFCNGNNSSMAPMRIVGPNENTSVKNFGNQSHCVVEFNIMDFVHREDYVACNSAMSINLNSVLDRIFKSIYNTNNVANQVMVVKMPGAHFGAVNFFVEKPVIIPYGVTLDLTGASVHVASGFKPDEGVDYSTYRRDDFVLAFASLPGQKNIVRSKVMNVEIVMTKELVKSGNYPKVVFNLTNFSGEMENVTVNLWHTLDTIAFWQPYGGSKETYSDRKIFRRCQVSNHDWRTKTPTAVFCLGDGCVIEQCILGYVAILGGNSYTIRGCLNDSYFIYDSTVDFTGSYWEVGQFQILDSKVRFAECKLACENNNLNVLSTATDGARHYLGPWMAVDTDGCRKRLKCFISNLQLGDDYFDQTKGEKNRTQYKGHATSQFSTVVFDPTIRFETIYWGYRQPFSGPLIKTGNEARLIGVENLEALNRTFIKNDVNAPVFNGSVILSNSATIPLVNGEFFDLGRNVELPPSITVEAKEGNEIKDNASKLGLDWGKDEVLKNISVRIVLDPDRNLYSQAFAGPETFSLPKNKEVYVRALTRMDNVKYCSNLMVELTFQRQSNGKYYRMRKHFSRVVMGDMVSFGDNDLIPTASTIVEIARFDIAKVYSSDSGKQLLHDLCDFAEVEKITDDALLDGIYTNITGALSDGCGNMYLPMDNKETYPGVTATKLQRIGEDNVRAYTSALPTCGKWIDGDQVVIGKSLFTVHDKAWYQTTTFTTLAFSGIKE